ncbi:MAG: hypothetical protein KTR35_18565 [Gammaproteobacteria bacterium]|nr:hypothetical protein [Gammaproteobacteria bacterium]
MNSVGFNQLSTRINELELRERILLLGAAVLTVYFLTNALFIEPLLKQQQILVDEIRHKESQIKVLSARSTLMGLNSDAESNPSMDRLYQELNLFNQELQQRLDTLLSPSKVASVLKQVLSQEPTLSLISVESGFTPLIISESEVEKTATLADISRYELELQLQGGYLETLSYLRALETLPWRLFWSDISFSVTNHPDALINIGIYTLGHPGI